MVKKANQRARSSQGGFTLLELTLVVTVVLMLAAIAVPNFLKSKSAAKRAAAVGNIRIIHSVQMAYSAQYPAMGFADALSKLGPPLPGGYPSPIRADMLDSQLGCDAQPCRKDGYDFQIDQAEGNPPTTFRITAVPVDRGRNGEPGFCGSSVGMISQDAKGGTNCVTPVSGALPVEELRGHPLSHSPEP